MPELGCILCRSIVAIALLISPQLALAAPGWTVVSPIQEVVAQELGLTIILANGSNPVPCSSTTWFRLPLSAANYEVIASAILTAKAQGKPVQLWASSCAPDGVSQIVAAWVKE